MRARSTIVGVLIKAITGIAVWSLCATTALAGPAPRSADSADGPRTSHAFSIRQLVRQAYVRGPFAKRLKRALHDLKTRTNRIGNGRTVTAHDDGQAIQNDTPVTQITDGPQLDLQPLGLFVQASPPATFTHTFSPRSPRGPPATLD
jgi:hypothetical protein